MDNIMLPPNVGGPVSAGPPDVISEIENREEARLSSEVAKMRLVAMDELLAWCNSFVRSSQIWRQQSFEDKWRAYQRMADSIYDPVLSQKKEAWQSKAFIPIVPSHRETIHASIFKTMIGPKPNIEVIPGVSGDQEQSEDIRDLIIRERARSRYDIEFDKVLADADTLGSGFARVRWEDREEERLVREPIYEPVDPVGNPLSVVRAMTGQRRVTGYQDSIRKVPIFRGVKFEYISTWDVFPDPAAVEMRGRPCALRYSVTFDEVVKGEQAGYYLPGTSDKLRGVNDAEDIGFPDKDLVKGDRDISNWTKRELTENQYSLLCYELWARLPQKWVYPFLTVPVEMTDPEGLVPARVLFHPKGIKAVEFNDSYDGESPLHKMDFSPVAGRFYGRGIPEMLAHIQEVINETVNQRIDNVSLVINRMFAVVEKAVVDRNDLVSKPGGCIRLNNKFLGPNGDVRTAIMPLEIPDVTMSSYRDVIEMERYAQERTAANRMTMGTAGQVQDANQTLGGMELLRQAANERFAYIGMHMEATFVLECIRAFWTLIYKNIQPDDIAKALGPERAQRFQLQSPEQVENDYKFEPQGVFTMESKSLRQARLQAIYQQFQGQPWLNHVAFFDDIAKSGELDPNTLKITPEEMQQVLVSQAMMRQNEQPIQKNEVSPGNSGSMGRPGMPGMGGSSQ